MSEVFGWQKVYHSDTTGYIIVVGRIHHLTHHLRLEHQYLPRHLGVSARRVPRDGASVWAAVY